MRFVHGFLGAILLLFAALQYDDPDGYYWGPVYAVAAAWSLLAAREPALLIDWTLARFGAPLSIVFFLAGFAWLAPTLGANWIHVEEARESLGYLICAGATALAVYDARRQTAVPGEARHEAD